ncbi:MAG: hypothetical protein M3371_11760, partial [Acidobacteriota bacterium]|nr:hypothetical protein [Acidobacteriota bacterium]
VSQLTPSTHELSFAAAPPVAGPVQVCVGPFGPIVPADGVEACATNGNGSHTSVQSRPVSIIALNAVPATKDKFRKAETLVPFVLPIILIAVC